MHKHEVETRTCGTNVAPDDWWSPLSHYWLVVLMVPYLIRRLLVARFINCSTWIQHAGALQVPSGSTARIEFAASVRSLRNHSPSVHSSIPPLSSSSSVHGKSDDRELPVVLPGSLIKNTERGLIKEKQILHLLLFRERAI